MASRQVLTVVSDLSGAEIPHEVSATVRFGLNRTDYEIDLTENEQRALRDLLAPYVTAARSIRRVTRAGAATTDLAATRAAPTPREIRKWASEHGHEVPKRGRIPELVNEAYRIVH